MNPLLELRTQMEIDFLKTKTYEEINDMFNQLKNKIDSLEKENKVLKEKGIALDVVEKTILERVVRPLVDSDYFDEMSNLPVSKKKAGEILSAIYTKLS